MKITESQLKQIIMEAAKKSLQEMRSGLCSKLMAIQSKFGDISQINLPEGAKIEDVKNEDIIKITKNPSPEENYNVKLSSGYYLIISPESETVKNGLAMSQQRNDLIAKRKELASKPVTRDEVIPTEDPEVARERKRREREIEKGFGSMKKVQDYIEEKYGQYLEFLTTRTRSGHDFVYQARISFISASYADGPSDVPQEVIDAVTKYLEPFGFYYAGVHGSSDEREFTSTGWYAWKRSGAVDPYERYMMRQAYSDSEMMYESKTKMKLTQSQLKEVIKESVKRVLKEGAFDTFPHSINKYDQTKESEYSPMDKLIVKLAPYYDRLSNDTFFANEKPTGNLGSLSAAKQMCNILNEFFGKEYIEIVRGGVTVILNDEDWFDGAYDMTEEFCNYSLQAKNGTPWEIKDELKDISHALGHGYLPGVADKIKSQEAEKEKEDREKNGGLKVLGKIDLSKVDPNGMNKKRW